MLNSLNISLRILLYVVLVSVMANVNAMMDLVLHDEINYFDTEHWVVGSIMGLLTAILCAMLENNIIKSRKEMSSSARLAPFTWFLATCWTIVVFASLTGDILRQREKIMDVALHEARTIYEKDLNYYRWATGHDGVFVPITEKTKPNPYLKHIPEYKITASNGLKLTLVNPEYMIRQVYEMRLSNRGALGHITSLDPIRPENAADPWERKALEAFEEGEKEIYSIEPIDDQPYLRLMRPMITEEGCLKCHALQGYEPGDIRGGISVSIPMAHLYTLWINEAITFLIGHLGLWVVGLIGMFLGSNRIRRSISERERAEARTRAIIDNMFDGLITIAEDGSIDTLNSAALRMFDYQPQDLIGCKLSKLVIFTGMTNENDQLQDDISKLVDNSRELSGRRRDGSVFPLQIAISRMIFGTQALFIAIVRDVTEEKIRKAEALQAGKLAAIGELAAGVAHEINNPINGVINYAQILYDDGKDVKSSDELDLMKRIIKEGERVAGIVRSLLAFARQRNEKNDDVRIKEIIADSLTLLMHQFQKEGIKIVVDVPDGLPVLHGNPQQLQQVFLNLLSNARYALNERFDEGPDAGKRVVIESRIVDLGGVKFLRTSFTDYGCGIPAEVINRIFDSLFSTKPPGQGTGLGLSISLDLVREHNGYLHVESEVNDHTTATVDLPIPAEAEDEKLVGPDDADEA